MDDNDLVRDSLQRCCQVPGLQVVGTAGSAGTAFEAVVDLQPDVVLLDYRLGQDIGTDVAPELIARLPGVRVIIVTGSADHEIEAEARRVGCSGCVEKTMATGRVIPDLVKRAYSGELI